MKNYDIDTITNLVAEVTTMAEFLRRLGYKRFSGGNYLTYKNLFNRFNINTNHWKGQCWNKGIFDLSKKRTRLNKSIRKYIIELKGSKCEVCSLAEWRGIPCVFEIHHEDGDPCNNDLSNLKVLCLLCHSQTKGWRGKGESRKIIPIKECLASTTASTSSKPIKYKKTNTCLDCGKSISYKAIRCKSCVGNLLPKKFEISKEELEALINQYPMTTVGKMLGVSDNAVRKRAKKLGITLKVIKSRKRITETNI